jgi:predicted regulator of Ras-like GTPase activity (Roadblock/LC7/MglB family)
LPNLPNTAETIQMLAFLKTLFRGRAAAPRSGGGLAIPRTVYTPSGNTAHTRRVATPRATPKPAAAPVPVPETAPASEHDSNSDAGSDVDIPLQSVLRGLPNDLKDRVRDLDIRGATMTISLERILAQLPSGAVKISFGSLRHAAPQLFSAGADCDSRDVALPFDEIMAKINPAMICRPQEAPRGPIEAKNEHDTETLVPAQPTAAPARGSTLSVPAPSAPGETVDQTPSVPATSTPRGGAPAAAQSTAPIRVPTPQVAKQSEKTASIEVDLKSLIDAWPADLRTEIAKWNLAEAKVALPVETVREGLKRGRAAFPWQTFRSWITPPPPTGESVHDKLMVELPLPIITPLFVTGQKQPAKPSQKTGLEEIPDLFFDARKGGGGVAVEPPLAIPTAKGTPAMAETRTVAPVAEVSAAPVEAPVAAQPSKDGSVMRIPLKELFESWPGELRAEIGHWNLPQLVVSLPAEQINAGLRQGKVAFPWKTLRSWIVPAPPSAASTHDKAILELPLPVIMPLFLAGQKPVPKAQPQIADDIPDPFGEFLTPRPADAASPAVTIAKPDKVTVPDTKSNGKAPSAPVVSPPVEKAPKGKSSKRKEAPAPSPAPKEVQAPAKVQPPAERPLAQAKRFPTPVEVLASAVDLEGVAGALVALSDGFKVASKLPPGLDGDVLAAFLPHIFSKVNQSARELRMGDLNSLNFTVDNIPWKIFRVNQIFFAALGHAGQPMPTEQLAALANKLTFKN